MNDDITKNPEITNRGVNLQMQQELYHSPSEDARMQQQAQMQAAVGVRCPSCGNINDEGAMFCASCGAPLGKTTCPNCGAELDADADFCETCRRYVKKDVCSFCGAHLNDNDAFCPECGSPRGGIVCPVCHTLNEFSFCKQCGTALTDNWWPKSVRCQNTWRCRNWHPNSSNWIWSSPIHQSVNRFRSN